MAIRAAHHPRFMLTAFVCSLCLVIALVIGCSETQPTTTGFSTTTLNLTPRSFPSPPAGMIYEMWLLRGNPTFESPLTISDKDVMSLGRFGWDQNIYIMRDENNMKRERVFELDLSILEWDYLAISVEYIDSVSARPSAIFLWDRIQDPKVDQFMSLKFPLGYDTTVTGLVSMQTPTDGDLLGNESGVWFAVYSASRFTLQDTFDIKVEFVSPAPLQIQRDSIRDDTSGTTLDTLGIDSVFPVNYLRFSPFNLDTFTVNTVRAFFHIVSINTDTVTWIDLSGITPDTIIGRPETLSFGDPAHFQTVIYQANRDYVFRTTASVSGFNTFFVNNFSNGFIDLHDLTGTGWHYKGWILGPHVTAEPTNFVRMNFGENKVINWEKEGRLMYGTGIWLDTTIDSVLDTVLVTSYGGDSTISRNVYSYSNEIGYNFPGDNGGFSDTLERPPFPGEDFLINLPLIPPIIGGGPAWNFFGTIADTAIAIITVEPDNYRDSTRNFPMIVLGRELGQSEPFINMRMMNFTGITEPFPNARQSWPHIVVEHILR
ncbi:MAG: hypothetical protein IH914_04215 [candidate division Zixibacteria bacterium]|nr:hypothetical protein [candidate division Zixibacteria bacterium]